MFGSHPIGCVCGNPQEGTRTGPPATSDAEGVCTPRAGALPGSVRFALQAQQDLLVC